MQYRVYCSFAHGHSDFHDLFIGEPGLGGDLARRFFGAVNSVQRRIERVRHPLCAHGGGPARRPEDPNSFTGPPLDARREASGLTNPVVCL